MGKRIAIVGLAVAAAAALLAVTLLLGPAGPGQEQPPGAIHPDDLPPGVNPDDLTPANTGPLPTHGTAGEGRITRVEDDRVTMLTWQTIEPAEAGVYEVGAPTATVEFSPQRVLTVTAEEATIIAPDGAFRRGEFRRDVVVTLYDAEGPEADLQSTRDIQVRVYLDDDAAFDLELGQITSTGPLHLTSRVADFKGRGLSLKYNRLRERIERLVVEQGDALRFAAQSDELSRDEPRGDEAEPDDTPPTAERQTTRREDEEEDDRGPQFYRARFQRDVHVIADGNDPQQQAKLRGDQLEVTFAIEPRSQSNDNPSPGSGTSVPVQEAPDSPEPDQDQPTPTNRSLLPEREDDIIVHWSGPLVLRPLLGDDAPTDPEHLQLALQAGDQTPATVRTARGDHITGDSVGYQQLGRHLLAAGSDTHPMRITSNELGELTGTRLELSQDTGVGFVLGPGRIVAAAQDDQAEAESESESGPATRSSIAWADRLDLRFFVDDDADAGQRLAALRHVTFKGKVRTEHEDYRLAGDHVEVEFERDPADPGRSTPRLLLARGDVTASQPGMTFAAQKLDATLSPRDAARAEQDIDGFTGELDVARVVAEQDIRVTIDERDATVTAARLVALPPQQTVELFGTDEVLAVLEQPEGRLAGRRIRLDQAAERVSVEGAGDFAHRLDEQDPEAVLSVVWDQRMTFDNRAGEAAFFGAVRAHSVDGPDTSELTADQLALVFEARPPDAEDEAEHEPEAEARAPQRIRFLEAIGEAAFSATAADPDRPQGLPRSRLLLEGPRLTFTNDQGVEQVHVQGPGRMLVENYAPGSGTGSGTSVPVSESKAQTTGTEVPEPEAPEPDAPEPDVAPASVNFAGRGATLFLWQGSLTLDAARNDMTLRDDVQMIHRPQDDEALGVVQLDCRLLFADLTETGGLTAWSTEGAPDPTLRLVEATDNVRLSQRGRQITSDHLRYTAKDRLVTLWSEDEPVELIDEAGGSSMTAEALKWDLAHDRFEALKLRSGIAPIKRD